MSDLTIQLLKLINEGKTLNEISETLNISHKRIFNHLTMIKNSGYDFTRSYYSNGDIIYTPNIKGNVRQYNNDVDLFMSNDEEVLRAVVISDIHIGSDKERLDLLDSTYNYCLMNGIHIIFNCGDMIDRIDRKGKVNSEDRVSYLLDNYPFDKSILNFIVLGNHDLSPIKLYGQNLMTVLNNYRHDLVTIGYGKGFVKIRDEVISLFHPHTIDFGSKIEYKSRLIFYGHSHIYKVNNFITPVSSRPTKILVPSLSDLYTRDISYPSILEMKLHFKENYFTTLLLNQLIPIQGTFVPVNENAFYFPSTDLKEINESDIEELDSLNTDELEVLDTEEEKDVVSSAKVKTLSREMGQIDKFNARWGK